MPVSTDSYASRPMNPSSGLMPPIAINNRSDASRAFKSMTGSVRACARAALRSAAGITRETSVPPCGEIMKRRSFRVRRSVQITETAKLVLDGGELFGCELFGVGDAFFAQHVPQDIHDEIGGGIEAGIVNELLNTVVQRPGDLDGDFVVLHKRAPKAL